MKAGCGLVYDGLAMFLASKIASQDMNFARQVMADMFQFLKPLQSTRGCQNRRSTPTKFRISSIITSIEGSDAPTGTLDITLFRDDLRMRPPRAIMPTKIPTSGIEGKDVILVDDVLFSGRTIRAALDALGEIGRPRTVQLAALVDRGHRELPIKADFIGKNLPTAKNQSVRVLLSEIDGRDVVTIEEGAEL